MIGLIFGPPGSGKGTQAARIEAEFGLVHLSTGDILRAEVARGTPIGKRVATIIAAGDLVPDGVILDLVSRRLLVGDGGPGYLLDGFPRTLDQARGLDTLLARSGRHVDFVVALTVPEDVVVERILHRGTIEGRPDDTRAAIVERMHEYRTRTAKVLERYRNEGRPVTAVDGVGIPDAVWERVRSAIPAAGA